MSRLADYFVVCGIDRDLKNGKVSFGRSQLMRLAEKTVVQTSHASGNFGLAYQTCFRCWILEEVKGKVIQRFPSKDRKDATFPEGLELVGVYIFCWKPVSVIFKQVPSPRNVALRIRHWKPLQFWNTQTSLQHCRIIPLVTSTLATRDAILGRIVKLFFFVSDLLLTDRIMFVTITWVESLAAGFKQRLKGEN